MTNKKMKETEQTKEWAICPFCCSRRIPEIRENEHGSKGFYCPECHEQRDKYSFVGGSA